MRDRRGRNRFKITIRNWEQHQYDVQGESKRKRRRSWICISVDLFQDPDFLALDHTHAQLWIGLLTHAGKVGPIFEMNPTTAKDLFNLYHRPNFRILEELGFIELEAVGEHEEPKPKAKPVLVAAAPVLATVTTLPVAKPKAQSKAVAVPDRFAEFWDAWPSGHKRNRKKTQEIWRRRKLDDMADVIIADVLERAQHDEAWLKDGGKFIPYPTTYLNGDRWEDDYRKAGPTQAQELLSGLREWNDEQEARERQETNDHG